MRQPWFASTMISRSRADGLAHRLDHRQVDAPVARVEAKLHRLYARVAEREAAANAFVRRDELAARRVGEDAVLACPRGAARAARPSARATRSQTATSSDPVPAMVEVDGLADPVDDLRVRRVDPDEEPLEQLAVGERVAARVALDAVVGADDDERRVLMSARLGIPCGRERRVERIAVAPRLDRRDVHHSPE